MDTKEPELTEDEADPEDKYIYPESKLIKNISTRLVKKITVGLSHILYSTLPSQLSQRVC